MNKIVTLDQAAKISSELKEQKKKIVLTGGCFDILHIGHVDLLENAKKHGDTLMVLLESDANIRRFKGANRPINKQPDRAKVLASLSEVDYVVILSNTNNDEDYDDIVRLLQPAIIATTIGDTKRSHKERQAAMVNAKVVDVNTQIANASTSKLASLLAKEL